MSMKRKAAGSSTTAALAVDSLLTQKDLDGLAAKGKALDRKKISVFGETSTFYDAMLNQADVKNNNNKFYIIQVLCQSGVGPFVVWNRWGRVGVPGQSKAVIFDDLKKAQKEFCDKFKSKTGNDYAALVASGDIGKNFVAKSGKYTFIERDGSDDSTTADEDAPAQKKQKLNNGGAIGSSSSSSSSSSGSGAAAASKSKLDKDVRELIVTTK